MILSTWLWRGLGPALCLVVKLNCGRLVNIHPTFVTLIYPLRCVHQEVLIVKERVLVLGSTVGGGGQHSGVVVCVIKIDTV